MLKISRGNRNNRYSNAHTLSTHTPAGEKLEGELGEKHSIGGFFEAGAEARQQAAV